MQFVRIIAVLLISLLASYPALAAFAGFQTYQPAQPSFTPAWQPLPVGAGGQVTAVYNYSDGTTLARSDNFGAWLYSPSSPCVYGGKSYSAPCWNNLLTATSIPSFNIDLTFREGAIEIAAAPSNTNVLYMLWNGDFYVSSNKGTTWTKCTNFVGNNQTANNGNASGPFIAVDPNNPDIVFVDTGNAGVYRSTNGTSGASATFTQVSGVGTTTVHNIVFQPGSSTHVLIYRMGTSGAYESTDGVNFSAITTGSPPPNTLTKAHLYADKFNQFWVADANGSTTIWRWASSTWTAISTGSTRQAVALAFDPASASVGANKVVVSDYYGQLNISTNNGSTWSGDNTNNTFSAPAGQPQWLGVANQGTTPKLLNGYSMTYDQNSNLLFAGGLGVWRMTSITNNAGNWAADTVGIEQLVTTQVIAPPGYGTLLTAWDKAMFLVKTPGTFPSTYWNNNTSLSPIIGGWGMDYCSSGIGCAVVWATSNISADEAPAYTLDGGNTWTLFPTSPSHPGAQGGAIAALDSQKWLVQPSLNQQLVYTLNGGTSWATSTIAGSPTNWTAGTGVGIPLAADRVTANTYCAVDMSQNFYSSTDSGQTFTKRINSGTVDGSSNSFTFKSTPGVADTYFYTAGEQSGAAGAHPANTHLWKITKTTNACDTATNVNTNLREVMVFGFGAHKPGASGTCPTLYAFGWLSGTQGVYYNTDCAATTTWTAIDVPAGQFTWPLNSSDFPKDMTGDPDIYGRILIGFAQSAGGFIDTADACPYVGFTNVKPNQALSGTSVTITAEHSGSVPVTGVNFYVDGVQIGVTQTGQTTYSVNLNATANAGSRTLKVEAVGNGCTAGGTGNSKSIPVTLS